MNWFKREMQKEAGPYSYNVCPHCANSLLLDFFWERGYGKNAIGRCASCHKPFKIQEYDAEESLGFKYSQLDPISESKFKTLQQEGLPELLVVQDEDQGATTPIDNFNDGMDVAQPQPGYAA